MNEIKCPNCGELFQVDESGYASIIKQVRDKEFSLEIAKTEERFKSEKELAVELAKKQLQAEYSKKIAENQAEITALQAKLDMGSNKERLAVSEAVSLKEKELSGKNEEITALKAKIAMLESEKKLAVSEAVLLKEQEIAGHKEQIALLNGKIKTNEQAFQLKEQTIKESYEEKIHTKDEQIAYYRDFKAKLSTKMVGDGYAMKSTSGDIYSPVSGTVQTIFPTKHAIGLVTENGLEILVHMGIDTVSLDGEAFEIFVKVGESVTSRTKIAHVDLEKIRQAKKDDTIIVVVTNMDKVESLSGQHDLEGEHLAGSTLGNATLS